MNSYTLKLYVENTLYIVSISEGMNSDNIAVESRRFASIVTLLADFIDSFSSRARTTLFALYIVKIVTNKGYINTGSVRLLRQRI